MRLAGRRELTVNPGICAPNFALEEEMSRKLFAIRESVLAPAFALVTTLALTLGMAPPAIGQEGRGAGGLGGCNRAGLRKGRRARWS